MAFLGRHYGDAIEVLVVEAATTRGTTLRDFERLRKQYLPNWKPKYAVLFNMSSVDFPVDFVAKTLERKPERYPWHATKDYRHHVSKQIETEAGVRTV